MMFKGRASSVIPHRGDRAKGSAGLPAKGKHSGIPVVGPSGKFPGRNLARPVGDVLEERATTQKDMNGNGNRRSSCFGFLRPTLSSMAKTKPHIQHDSIKSNESGHNKSPNKTTDDVHQDVILEVTQEEGASRSAGMKMSEPGRQGVDDDRALKPLNHSSPFTIYETSDDSLDAPVTPMEPCKRQTIFSTPKYPRTRSLEKNTKRRLQFRQQIRPQHAHERLRNTSSPPPDFDFTVNTAAASPSYVPPVSNYEVFSTPIVNLTTALSLSDEENETVYYTPCAEF